MDNNISATQIAEAVMQQLAAHAGPAVSAPLVTVRTPSPEVNAAPGAINGSVDIEIIYNGTSYILSVHSPTIEQPEYTFQLKYQPSGGKETTIAAFEFKDGSNWLATVGLPIITIGKLTIQKVQIAVGAGTTKALP